MNEINSKFHSSLHLICNIYGHKHGLRDEGIHIRQNMSAHVTTTSYVLCMGEHQLKPKTVTSLFTIFIA